MIPFPTVQLKQPIPAGPCKWNPGVVTDSGSITSLFSANDNLLFISAFGGGGIATSTLGTTGKSSGKLYFEIQFEQSEAGAQGIGIAQAVNPVSPYKFGGSGHGVQYSSDGSLVDVDTFGTIANYTPPIYTGAGSFVAQFAADLDSLLIWAGSNGVMVGNPAAGTGGQSIIAGTYYPAIWLHPQPSTTISGDGFFSQGQFRYGPPVGFSQWR